MKKLLILSLIAFFALSSAKVFAQDSGVTPSIGTTHLYYVNSSDGTSQDVTGHTGNTYKWWISTDGTNLLNAKTSGDAAYADFTVNSASGSAYNTPTDETSNGYKMSLTWNSSSEGNTYYLVVEEKDASGCLNLKAVAIQPANTFKLQYAIWDGTNLLNANTPDCAPAVTASALGTTITYDYGSGDFEFKLIPTGLGSAATWSFTPTLTLGNATGLISYSTDNGVSFSTPAAPAAITGIAGDKSVIVKVTIANGQAVQDNTGTVTGTFVDGTTVQNVTMSISNIVDDGSHAVTEITDAASNDITSSPVQTQTVKARPGTSVIGFN
ncbi:hypothetical protein [Prolixibacter sp. SD074]|uniref:hypothetical protein n=1 Tax=Prolixibacter sp. SD074 TaxID=2652391 RepID=UPI0012992135|nr:hypothetical protein [Prolixibacter sp. SD074]